MLAAGAHNFDVLLFASFFVGYSIYMTYRLVIARDTARAIRLSARGISFVPKSSALIQHDFNWLSLRHREEFIRLTQKGPSNNRIDRRVLTGHLDNVKFSQTGIEIELIGQGEGVVLFDMGIKGFDRILSIDQGRTGSNELPLLSSDRLVQLRNRAKNYGAPFRFSGEHKVLIPDDPSRTVEEERVPYVVAISSQSHIELTFFNTRSVSGSVQFLLPYTASGAVHVVPLYFQNVDECMVCYDRKSNTVVLNCRHCCICTECIAQLRDNRCIVCRQTFTQYIFLPRVGDELTQPRLPVVV